MALIHCDFFSEVLGVSTSMYVILPQATKNQIGMEGRTIRSKHPTLYLLHGLSDDHTIWLRRTSIERYVAPLGLAVVMPAVGRSFYTDMKNGYRYWTFISEELPEIARSFFPLSDKREDNFVAGLSMGGYGAFKLALRCPDKYAAAASLSGALDIVNLVKNAAEPMASEFYNIFGDPQTVEGSDNDLYYLAQKVAQSQGPKPKLYQCCGTEDFLYQGNIAFRDYCQKLGLDITYEEGPGQHEWGFWDKYIQNVLKWLPL
ncbi:S-formylglutathione hydrolase FrmB [Caldanaerobius fijiensis DSM 17918]|uniref:S-formylglutathione hydrolase FrmB n=1 Tax=Caldanaerobius fijiensis DSM 17918 TaxID=1121256 RepID=A0A1M4ZDN8_9THEO|nr:alpha/beta hydrolase family protein [Caldanaerobius fijiensis]SHF16154.1 S-formylglutathione hydrolase FrmB [Caldanaerobius fijiensis DSM 17918]